MAEVFFRPKFLSDGFGGTIGRPGALSRIQLGLGIGCRRGVRGQSGAKGAAPPFGGRSGRGRAGVGSFFFLR